MVINLETHQLVAGTDGDGIVCLHLVPKKWIEKNNIENFQKLYDNNDPLLKELDNFPDIEEHVYGYVMY